MSKTDQTKQQEQAPEQAPPAAEAQPKYRVLHDQIYPSYEEADRERRVRVVAAPDLRVRVRRLKNGYRLVVRERLPDTGKAATQ